MKDYKEKLSDRKISREEAIKKAGKYAIASAATLFIVLSPREAQAQSPPPPGW